MSINTAIKHLTRRKGRLSGMINQNRIKGNKPNNWQISEMLAIEVAIKCMMRYRLEEG